MFPAISKAEQGLVTILCNLDSSSRSGRNKPDGHRPLDPIHMRALCKEAISRPWGLHASLRGPGRVRTARFRCEVHVSVAKVEKSGCFNRSLVAHMCGWSSSVMRVMYGFVR